MFKNWSVCLLFHNFLLLFILATYDWHKRLAKNWVSVCVCVCVSVCVCVCVCVLTH